MRRLWAALGLILALALLAGWHVHTLGQLTGSLTQELGQARQLLFREEWDRAQDLVEQASGQWEAQAPYLHTTLRHGDIDDVRSGFHEALAYLEAREDPAECAAVCARLVNLLELILEGEQPSLKNIL